MNKYSGTVRENPEQPSNDTHFIVCLHMLSIILLEEICCSSCMKKHEEQCHKTNYRVQIQDDSSSQNRHKCCCNEIGDKPTPEVKKMSSCEHLRCKEFPYSYTIEYERNMNKYERYNQDHMKLYKDKQVYDNGK